MTDLTVGGILDTRLSCTCILTDNIRRAGQHTGAAADAAAYGFNGHDFRGFHEGFRGVVCGDRRASQSLPQHTGYHCLCPSGTAASVPSIIVQVPLSDSPRRPWKVTLSPSCLSLQALIASGGGPCASCGRRWAFSAQPVRGTSSSTMRSAESFSGWLCRIVFLLFVFERLS